MVKEQVRAFWVTGPCSGALRQEALPDPGPGELRLRSLYSAVSRGTDSLVYGGRVPPSQYQAMRAPHQAGDFPWPVKYGYSNVARVEAGPAEVEGRRVFCLYPHQEAYVLDAQAVVPLPEALPSRRAALAANMETALNATWDAAAAPDARIAVIGAGVVGCLTAYLLAKAARHPVQLIDIDPAKAAVAERLGTIFRQTEEAEGDMDLVVHASGNPTGLTQALQLAAFEGEILELSWYGDTLVPLPLGEAFHARRLTLRSSQVGQVAPARRATTSHRQRLTEALDLLADPVLDCLITGESPFEDLPATMDRLARAAGGTLCHLIAYET